MVEVIITAAIVASAVYIFYKSLKKKAKGKCDGCAGKSAYCSMCETEKK
jgi:hypothetical protein